MVCWGRQAEIAGQYLTRGKKVYVEGRLQTQSWEDRQTGEKKYRTEIVCENFQMLGGGSEGGRQAGGYGGGGQGGYRSYEPNGPVHDGGGYAGGYGGIEPEDDDIPF